MSRFHSRQSYTDGFLEKRASEELQSLCLSYADPILPALNEHLPEPPSEVGVEDLGFIKLPFLPWKKHRPLLSLPLKNALFYSLWTFPLGTSW